MSTYPVLMHTALDSTDVRRLAEFYRDLLGLQYRPGDEPPQDDSADDEDWLVLVDSAGNRMLAFQEVSALARPTWPSDDVPKQMHLDFRVPTVDELERHRQRSRGARGHAASQPHRGVRGASVRSRRPGRAPLLHPRRLGVSERSAMPDTSGVSRDRDVRPSLAAVLELRRPDVYRPGPGA